jgi:uncharacterized protein with FMN-binding domain
MADQWELDTLNEINNKRTELGLPPLVWSNKLESEARNYWTNPESCKSVVNTCNCPHWTSPKNICDLLWDENLANYFYQYAAIAIYNDQTTHVALALTQEVNNMPYKHIPIKPSTSKNNDGNWITGSRDAKYLHNKYQTELDNAHIALVNMIHHIEDENRKKALRFYNEAQALREDIKAHQAERTSLYEALDAQLEKELGQEYKMWKTSPQGLRINTKEGLKSDTVQAGIGVVGNINPTPILRYLERYPELSAKSRFSEITSKIKEKEREIRTKTEACNRAISGFNNELPFYDKNVIKCQDNLNRYFKILEEGNEKINSCRYIKSSFFKILPEDKKDEIRLNTLTHPMDKWKNMLALFKEDLSKYQKQHLSQLSYS